MKETYYLNQDTLPSMPVPHDCIINKIMLEEQSLVFSFTSDISRYDSVRNLRPNAKSLTIRYHLIDDVYWLYKSFNVARYSLGKVVIKVCHKMLYSDCLM